MGMSLASKYKKSLAENWTLRFKTIHPDDDNYDGVVTHIKPDFIVIREQQDFEFDGVIILPKRVIKGYRDNRYDECCNKIIRQNGQLGKLKTPSWLNKCNSIYDVLTAIQKRDIWPAVEMLHDEGKTSALYLGPIEGVYEDSFYLNCYDAAGKWEKPYYLTLANIFRIEFDSKYCRHFNRYMRLTNPPKT